MAEVKKSSRIAVVAIGMVLVGFAIGVALGLYLPETLSVSSIPKYSVRLTYAVSNSFGGTINGTFAYYVEPLIITFNQVGGVVAKCYLGTPGVLYYIEAPTANVTLPEGEYVVNAFDTAPLENNLLVKTLVCYVDKEGEINLTFGAYAP